MMNSHYKWSIASGTSLLIAVLWYTADNPLTTNPLVTGTLSTTKVAQPLTPTKQIQRQKSAPDPALTNSPFQEFNTTPPKYLTDTELRGQLTTLADGSLLITDEIRKRFDYFYMMTGDRSQQEINAIIIDHIHQTLSDPALTQA